MGGAVVKNPPGSAGDARDAGSYPGLGRSSGIGNGNPLQYSCLENSMDRGAWWATVHGIAKSQTWLRDWSHTQMGECIVNNGHTLTLIVPLIPQSPFLWWSGLESALITLTCSLLHELCLLKWAPPLDICHPLGLTLHSSHGDHIQFCSDLDPLSADTTSCQHCTVSLPSFWRLLSHYWIPSNLLATHICATQKCRADKCLAPPVTDGETGDGRK